MEKQIEVEHIGKINKEKFNELKILFEKDGKFLKRKERISFMYFRDEIPKDISGIKEEDTDLRLRITNKEPELIVKNGLFTGTHSRKEISIIFDKKDISNYVGFLSALGWDKGVIYAVETFVYEYEEIEFSLVEILDYGFNFEAEILTTEGEQDSAVKKIKEILNKLSLIAFDEEGLDKQCNEVNNRIKLRFDFSDENIKEYLERFPRFF